VALKWLGYALYTRFEKCGASGDVQEAIALQRQALELRPSSHPQHSETLRDLIRSLTSRFGRYGKLDDLDEAIRLCREALELHCPGHPERSRSLNNLMSAVLTRFEQYGKDKDLEEAIVLQREALELRPPGHPDRSMSLNNLSNAVLTRFEQYGKDKALEEGVVLQREALELRPPGHPLRSMSLNNLANAVLTRFEQYGKDEDLEEATVLQREALELCPPGHPLRSMSLNNLANAVLTRFEQYGKDEDLEEAIVLQREALELRPPGHPGRSMSLNNLAYTVLTRFEQYGKNEDLEEAIVLEQEALELRPPGHPLRSMSLNNLAKAVRTRFKQYGKDKDLEEAIVLQREGLELRPPGHPGRSSSLNNLANAVLTRFKQYGKDEDLEEAIVLQREALELRPPGHPDHSQSLMSLGSMFLARFGHLGRDDSLHQAMSSYAKATHNSLQPSLLKSFHSAREWALRANEHRHPSDIEAFDAVLGILPQLAALSLDIKARQTALPPGSSGLACLASKCAIRNGNLQKAVEFLEAGRGVFWSQILRLRSPVDRLRDIAPQLADALIRVSTELDAASHQVSEAANPSNSQKITIEQEQSRLQRLNKERSNTLDAIRRLPAFTDFLLPLRLATLQRAANTSPVVFLVANDEGSDCLVMTSTDIHHIQLPNLPTETLREAASLLTRKLTGKQVSRSFTEEFDDIPEILFPAFDHLIRKASTQVDPYEEKDGPQESGVRGDGYGRRRISSDAIFKLVLKVLWVEVVQPVIQVLHLRVCASNFSCRPVTDVVSFDIEVQRSPTNSVLVSHWTIRIPPHSCSRPIWDRHRLRLPVLHFIICTHC